MRFGRTDGIRLGILLGLTCVLGSLPAEEVHAATADGGASATIVDSVSVSTLMGLAQALPGAEGTVEGLAVAVTTTSEADGRVSITLAFN